MEADTKKQSFIHTVKNRVLSFLKTDAYNGVFVLIALVLLNITALDYNFKIDLTRDGVYSLSPVSKRSVKNLSEPMTIKIFYSEELSAEYNNVRLYLNDLMQEYKANADANFSYQFMDMNDPEMKKQAESYGIMPAQINQQTGDEFTATRAYLGLAIIHGDLLETVNELTNTQGLEYRITTTIAKMKSKLNLLSDMENNIQLTLYVSDDLKEYRIFPADIDRQLDQAINQYIDGIKEENSGKIDYSFKNISAGEIQTMVSRYGFKSFAWPQMNTQQGEVIPEGKGLIGVLIESGDKFSTLSIGLERSLFGFQLSGLDGLGERINDAIDSMLSNNPAIGYMTSSDTRKFEQQNPQSAEAFYQLISSMYEIREIDLEKEDVPASIKTLVVNGPKRKLSAAELYRIDSFIMGGGNVLFLVDPFFEVLPNQQQNQLRQPFYIPLDIGMSEFLETYGVKISRDYVMDKNCFVMRQQDGSEVPLYFAPDIMKDRLDDESVATRYLNRMLLIKASSMELDADSLEKNGITGTELMKSSEEAWTMKERIILDPNQMPMPGEDELGQYTLGVLLEGVFPSNFADGLPEELKGEDNELTVEGTVAKGVTSSRIAVIGTSELTTAQLIDPTGSPRHGEYIYNNTLFVQNLIDQLNGDDSIPQMRSKGLEGSLKDVDPATRFFSKTFNIYGLPILTVLLGLLFYRMRIMRKRKIEKMFSEAD